MISLFKHLTVRLWLTAMLGGVLCMAILPWWQQFFGLHWLMVPVLVMLSICFGTIGWLLNRLGISLMGRYINEATVWERAGMTAEAENALQQAAALFDSIWLSPLQRRKRSAWITAILARFYLGQASRSSYARHMVATYLHRYPEDQHVAEGWLEQVLNWEHYSTIEFEAAARIGAVLGDLERIQQLLMQFYLNNGRSDFDALQMYKQVWQQQSFPSELVSALTRLLLNEGVLTHWALQVYLCAWRSGIKDALDGIAAAVHWLQPTVENRQDLELARHAVFDVPADRIKALAGRFKPTAHETRDQLRQRTSRNRPAGWRTKVVAKELVTSSRSWAQTTVSRSAVIGKQAWAQAFAHPAIVGSALVLLIMALFVLGWQLRGRSQAPLPSLPIEEVKPVIEPFTIQVAAYVKSEDAQRVVDRLVQQQLDAFWTQATSADHTWYQVKVGHFETKEQARLYGQDLKTRGLIDDFYVANYQKSQRQIP